MLIGPNGTAAANPIKAAATKMFWLAKNIDMVKCSNMAPVHTPVKGIMHVFLPGLPAYSFLFLLPQIGGSVARKEAREWIVCRL
jgi:hypothetical protein